MKRRTVTKLKKGQIRVHLHSLNLPNIDWLCERIRPISECFLQGEGAAEVCYGTYAALAEHQQALCDQLIRHRMPREDAWIGVIQRTDASGQQMSVWLIMNKSDGYHG